MTDFDIFGDDDKNTDKAGGKIVSTYKEGAGFDASWTVVHASNVDEWFAIHDHPRFQELLERQKKTAGEFRGGGTQAAAPARGAAPAGASAPPRPDNVPPHFTFRSGVKNGKTWKGWFPPQGSNESPIWG